MCARARACACMRACVCVFVHICIIYIMAMNRRGVGCLYHFPSLRKPSNHTQVVALTRTLSGFVLCGSWTVSLTLHERLSSPQFVGCLLVGCLTSQQQASVSQGRICSDNFTCCHTEIEVADPTFYLTQSQYTDTGPTSPSAGPITPGAWQGSHWSANFEVTGMTRPRKNPGASVIRTRTFRSRGGRLNH